MLLSWCLFRRVIKNFSFGWEVACNFFFFFFLAFSMTWRIRTLQSLQFELNYPVKKPNPVLTLSIISSSSSISKDKRELQRFQLQNISQFPGPLMEFSHKPDVGGSDLASYICPKNEWTMPEWTMSLPQVWQVLIPKGSTSMRCSHLEILDSPTPSPRPPPPSPPPSPSNHQSPGVLYCGPEIQAETCFLTKDLFPSYLT